MVSVTQQGFPVDDRASDGRGALSERSEFANTVIHRRTGGHRKRSVLLYHSTGPFVNSNYIFTQPIISPLHNNSRYDTIKYKEKI